MRKLRPLWFLLLSLLAVPLLHADTVTMQLTGVNGANNGIYYVSPYYGTMNGAPVVLFCIDILNGASLGQTWQANLTPLTTGSDLSLTRFGSLTDAIALYQQAAWLTTQFPSHPNDYVNLQYALWNLFAPSAAPDSPGSIAWLQLAQANYTSPSFVSTLGSFRIVTNAVPPVQLTGSGQVQEYITMVPEPGTMALLGLGLTGIGGLLRRRQRS